METIRRQLAPRLEGRRVVAAGGHPSPKFAPAAAATGATVTEVGRRGKYLIAELAGLDDRRELVVHLGMTGALSVVPTTEQTEAQYIRAWWRLDDGHTLALHDVRRFGRVAVVPAGDHRALPTLARLGPEPFDPAFDPAALHAGLARSRARIKTQLLGQRVVAGVGNIYADEALWRSGIHPGARRLSRPRAATLLAAIRHVLRAGIPHGGTRLRDYRSLEGDTGANQLHLACYGRAGQPCTRCDTPLRRTVLDARTTTFCPTCQKR